MNNTLKFAVTICLVVMLCAGCAAKKTSAPEPVAETGRFEQATGAMESGKYKQALQILNSIVADGRPEVINAIGVCYLRLGKAELATEAFEKFIEMVPGSAAGYINLGNSHFMLGNYEEAEKAYLEAKDLGAASQAAIGLAACKLKADRPEVALRELQQIDTEKERSIAFIHNRILAFYELKLYHDTLVIIESELQKHPRDVFLLNMKGLVYLKQKDYVQAAQAFDGAIKQDSSSGKLYLNRGIAYLGSHNYADAEADFTRALAYDAALSQAYVSRAEAKFLQEKKTEACEDLAKACDYGLCDRFQLYEDKKMCK